MCVCDAELTPDLHKPRGRCPAAATAVRRSVRREAAVHSHERLRDLRSRVAAMGGVTRPPVRYILGKLVGRLHADGLLTHDLGRGGRFGNAAPERSATYLGVCRVGEAYRRIDIKVSDP